MMKSYLIISTVVILVQASVYDNSSENLEPGDTNNQDQMQINENLFDSTLCINSNITKEEPEKFDNETILEDSEYSYNSQKLTDLNDEEVIPKHHIIKNQAKTKILKMSIHDDKIENRFNENLLEKSENPYESSILRRSFRKPEEQSPGSEIQKLFSIDVDYDYFDNHSTGPLDLSLLKGILMRLPISDNLANYLNNPQSSAELPQKVAKEKQIKTNKFQAKNFFFLSMLLSNNHLLCNVIHIHKYFAITGASCVTSDLDVATTYVTAVYQHSDMTKTRKYGIRDIAIHPKYDEVTNDFNIAILLLSVPEADPVKSIRMVPELEKGYSFNQVIKILRWRQSNMNTNLVTLASKGGLIVHPKYCSMFSLWNSYELAFHEDICVETENSNFFDAEKGDIGTALVGMSPDGEEYLIGYYSGVTGPELETLLKFEPIQKYYEWIFSYVKKVLSKEYYVNVIFF